MGDTMLLVRATLALYRSALRDSARALASHLWIVILIPAYSVLLGLVGGFAGQLGFAGGMLVYLAVAACASSFLALVADIVEHERVRPSELGPSFGRYLGRLVSLLFFFWIIQLLLSLITQRNHGLMWLALAVDIGIFLLCNPLPELIYQGTRDGIAMIDEAIQFTRENAVEWLLPVAVMVAPFFLVDVRAGIVAMAQVGPTSALALVVEALESLLPGTGAFGRVLIPLLASAILAWIMLFRGFLFRALARGGRRQRIFEARMHGG